MPAADNAITGFLTAAEGASPDDPLSPVDRILDAVRAHLGMDIAFASRFVDGRREFTHIRAGIEVPASPGDSEPLEDTFCHRILEGRLPELIRNAPDHEAAHEVALTAALPIGAHLNVPLRLSDGSLYGSFCCLSQQPDHSLTERDLNTLRAFAELAAGQIERDLDRNRRSDGIRARVESILAEERLGIVYQPIHALAGGAAVGVECLARFPEDDAPPRPPSAWFEEAAEVGLGLELELLAVRLALLGLPFVPGDIYLAVNVSPDTAQSGRLDEILGDVPAGRIVVEVTEHSRIADYSALRAALARLRSRSRLAIDDVGAGYAGLRHIVDLAPDVLKLDMALTRDVDADDARRALVQAMVAFARRIGCDIVAEGVETAAEAEVLAGLGVAYAQGYYFSRPMPAVAVQQFLLGVDACAAPQLPAAVRPRRAAR